MSGLYDFSGASLAEGASYDLPPATDNGGFFDTGVSLLNNVADKWLAYQDIKTRNDLEYSGFDARTVGGAVSSVPGWVWGIGALAVGFMVYKAVR